MDVVTVGALGALAIVVVTALAPRVGVSAPLVLLLFGAGLGLLPVVPAISVQPEWILAGVLPPLLYSTSVAMPTMDFRRDLTAISGLSVLLMIVSSLTLGYLFTLLIPGIGLAIGIALGAIVSPTDAVAVTIIRRLNVAPRLVTVLEGESLLNDATALVLLRSAIAASAVAMSVAKVAWTFVFSVIIAAGIGAIIGRLSLAARSRIGDASLNTAISFIVPFLAYVPAEHLHASGLVSAVSAGLVAGAGSARYLRPEDRIAEAANWHTLEVLLEGAVFFVMGLQLYGLTVEFNEEGGALGRAVWIGVLAATAVCIVRAVFFIPLLAILGWRDKYSTAARDRIVAIQRQVRGELESYAQFHADDGTPGPARPGKPGSAKAGSAKAGSTKVGSRKAGSKKAGSGKSGTVKPGWAKPASAAGGVGEVRATVGDDVGPAAGAAPAAGAGDVVPVGAGGIDAVRAGVGDIGKASAAPAAAERPHRVHLPSGLSPRLTRRAADAHYRAAQSLGWREGVVLVWAGMRGVVTLAAAQSLPEDTPQRPTLVLVAFVVAVGTLLVQGGTLSWVVRSLGLVRVRRIDREDRRRLVAVLGAAAESVIADPQLRRRNGKRYDPNALARVRRRVVRDEQEIVTGDARGARSAQGNQVRELLLRVIAAQRAALLEARRLGIYPSAVLRDALAVLDAEQRSTELKWRQG